MMDGYLARKLHTESKTGAVLDSIADICFVACCGIRLWPVLQIPMWLWIWAGGIIVIKLVNQVSALIVCKRFCFPHTKANKLTGLLLFLSVPAVFWSVVPITFVAAAATFAAVQEGHFIIIGIRFRYGEGRALDHPRSHQKEEDGLLAGIMRFSGRPREDIGR